MSFHSFFSEALALLSRFMKWCASWAESCDARRDWVVGVAGEDEVGVEGDVDV